MATSLIGGAFGYLRKSIGSVTYTTSTSALDGKRRQVARQKVTVVRNPNTVAQIMQRMKVVPATMFYNAFEKAAGTVENNPLSHSFEGYPYGAKNRLRFNQLALQGDPKAYVPKGYEGAAPGIYQVSEGSLPSLPSGNVDGVENAILEIGDALDNATITKLAALGVEVGDQLTCLGLFSESGNYKAVCARIIVKVGNEWEYMNSDSEHLKRIMLCSDGLEMTSDPTLACAAFILSRGINTANAKRSTAIMTIAPAFESLMSNEAMQAAIDSYLNNTTYNSLNSDWYLNQGTPQAFNGQVIALPLSVSEGEDSMDAKFLVGRVLRGNEFEYTVFTSDGTAGGGAYLVNENNKVVEASYPENPQKWVSGTAVIETLQENGYSTNTMMLVDAIVLQGGFTMG